MLEPLKYSILAPLMSPVGHDAESDIVLHPSMPSVHCLYGSTGRTNLGTNIKSSPLNMFFLAPCSL